MTRMATVKRFPGNQYISKEGALQLIKRGTFPARVTDMSDEAFFTEPSETEEVRFRHDPKLILPSYVYNTHEQVSESICISMSMSMSMSMSELMCLVCLFHLIVCTMLSLLFTFRSTHFWTASQPRHFTYLQVCRQIKCARMTKHIAVTFC